VGDFICQLTLLGAASPLFRDFMKKSVNYFWVDMKDAKIRILTSSISLNSPWIFSLNSV